VQRIACLAEAPTAGLHNKEYNMKRPTKQARSRVIGMDIHPSCFSASAFQGRNIEEASHLWTHDKVELPRMLSWASKHLQVGDIVVMESGSNSFEWCTRLIEKGYQAVVLESFSVGQIGNSYLKNDAVDSIKIAKVYLSGLAKEVWKPDEVTRERREILANYQCAVRDCTRSQNRLTGWATQHGLQRPNGMTWKSIKAKPWMFRQRAWTIPQQMLIKVMFADLKHTLERKEMLASHMAEEVMSNPTLMRLLQICGIRHITAYALAAVIGDISRFKTPKKLVAYMGLNPRVNESGINKSSGRLAHNGRKDVRHFLVQGAQAVLKQDPKSNRLARWGQALAYRRNKQVACIAVARKLLTAVWYLWNGFKPAMKERTGQLKIKLSKIGGAIGKERLNELGYKKRAEFIDEKFKYVLGST
jgi:transposase